MLRRTYTLDLRCTFLFFSPSSLSFYGTNPPRRLCVEKSALVLQPVCLQPQVELWLKARRRAIADDLHVDGTAGLTALSLSLSLLPLSLSPQASLFFSLTTACLLVCHLGQH